MSQAYGYLLATVSTPGGMATVLNWEGHVGRRLTDPTDRRLARLLRRDVPPECLPAKQYQGQPRLIVPTVRTQLCQGESLKLKIIVLASERPKDISFYWRSLGSKNAFATVSGRHIARGVYRVRLPADEIKEDFEYYIETNSQGRRITFPATAPTCNQTVVVVSR